MAKVSLCERSEAMREVRTAAGARYLLCGRSAADPRYPKYPPQPLLRCDGFAARREIGAASAGQQPTPRESSAVLAHYYSKRAPEYEEIYKKPERQADLRRLEEKLCGLLAGQRVLDVACGTGYWIERYAEAAEHVVGIDRSQEALAIARAKPLPAGRVELVCGDAFSLAGAGIGGGYTAALLAFWWSHLEIGATAPFLAGLVEHLAPRALVIAIDNRFVEGSSTPIARRDAAGNTYQKRRLATGEEFEVLKNFPDEAALVAAAAPFAARDASGSGSAGVSSTGIAIELLTHYWMMTFRTRG